jgi:hypothetical protein
MLFCLDCGVMVNVRTELSHSKHPLVQDRFDLHRWIIKAGDPYMRNESFGHGWRLPENYLGI